MKPSLQINNVPFQTNASSVLLKEGDMFFKEIALPSKMIKDS